jgi:serine/threonine protein phosphatase PrpC
VLHYEQNLNAVLESLMELVNEKCARDNVSIVLARKE